MKIGLIPALAAALLPAALSAQELVHPLPAEAQIETRIDLVYAQRGDTALKLDLYRPAHTPASLPVLIIYNGFQTGGMKSQPQQSGWARLATGAGLAAIAYDSHAGGAESDFDALTSYVQQHAGEMHIDATRIVFMAW